MKHWGFFGVILSLSALGCSDGSADAIGAGGSCGDERCVEDESTTADEEEGAAAEQTTSTKEPNGDDGAEAEDAAEAAQAEAAEEEPITSLSCGTDGETEYAVSCEELQPQCVEAGGFFLCHDEELSDSCQTWGTCSFIDLEGLVVLDGKDDGGDGGGDGEKVGEKAEQQAEPLPLDIQSPFPVELADVSIFECGEGGKMCCLLIPGKGDASADCGGFLQNCSDVGGTPKGGGTAANCTW